MISAAFAQVHRDWVRYLTYKPRHGPDDLARQAESPDDTRHAWYYLVVPDGTSTDGMVFTACT
jgi:hypothetical protein